jgi:hypothetical protein
MATTGPDVQQNALKVVRALRESAMDGYRLMARTGLAAADLIDAVSSIPSVVGVKGELLEPRIGEAYLFVFPNAMGVAEMMVKNPSYKP